jgi:isopenicillin N synthase-like dioxygenase
MEPVDYPKSTFPPTLDAKWRFFWSIGERPSEKKEEFPKTIPKGFPDWEPKMDKWGYKMIDACLVVAEMAAIGLDIDKNTFTSRMKGGPHLLAPTGSDLIKYD